MEKLDRLPISVFLPVSKYLIAWYFILLLVMSFDFVVTIIVICYQNFTAKIILYDYVNLIIFPLLILDIFLTFNTGFIKDGKLILVRKNIINNYTKSAFFLVDLWSAVWSLTQIIVVHAFETQFPYLTLLIYLKMVKIKAIDGLIVKYILRSSRALFYYQIAKNLFFLALVCHVFGSLFFLIDVQIYNAGWYQNTKFGLWTIESFCYPDILNQDFGIQYTYSFYFIIVTLSGVAYGDLVPLNPTQTIYVFACVAFPILIYAYLFSVIYSAISEERSKRVQIFRTRVNAKFFFNNLGIKHTLRHKLLNYIAYYYKNKLASSNQFMNDLAPSLRQKYKVEALQRKIDLTIFNPIGWGSIPESVCQIVKQQFVPQRYNLGKQNKLLYINEGKVIEFIKMKSKFSKIIKKHQFIGQYTFFTGILNTSINVQTSQFTVCQTISYSDFKQTLKQNSAQLNESYCLVRDQVILYGKVALIRHECFFCSYKQHDFQHCPHLRGNITNDQISEKTSFRNQGIQGRFRRNKIQSKKIFQLNLYKNASIGCLFFDNQTQVDLQFEQHHDIDVAMRWSLKYYPVYNIF